MMEEWRPVTIKGYEIVYQVSNLGRVKSLQRGGRILADARMGAGYRSVGMTVDGKVKRISVHRLVALAFVPGYKRGLEVDHINGDKTDNRASNLRWVTHGENVRKRKKVRKPKGRYSSQYKGVGWDKAHNCWQAYICAGKQKRLGLFNDEKEAARAYDAAALEAFGEYARLNFPEEAKGATP